MLFVQPLHLVVLHCTINQSSSCVLKYLKKNNIRTNNSIMYCLLTDVYIRRLLFIRFMNKWCRYFVTVQIHSGMRGPIAGVNRSNVWIFCDGMF